MYVLAYIKHVRHSAVELRNYWESVLILIKAKYVSWLTPHGHGEPPQVCMYIVTCSTDLVAVPMKVTTMILS
jgi:hypothetical protein